MGNVVGDIVHNSNDSAGKDTVDKIHEFYLLNRNEFYLPTHNDFLCAVSTLIHFR